MGEPAHPLPADLRVFDRGWLSSTNVLCLGEAPALIDTGHAKHAARTVALVREALGGQPLARIAHTHLHSDHCGGTQALQAAWPETATWVPEPSLPHVRDWDEAALTFGASGQRCERFAAGHALRPGETVRLGARDWQVHAAPGHDALAVLLFEPARRILVAGDALWEHGVGVIFPHIDGSGGFDAFERTLQAVEALRPDWVIPGHGPAIVRAGGALEAALAQARERIRHFQAHPAQHALYAAKVLIKYQMMDFGQLPRAEFDAWLAGAPLLRLLHRQHRPDLAPERWVRDVVLAPMFDKGVLRQDATHVRDGR
ncbi:MBL fold metallo-hydrolase [Ottowia sp.]|jgi:glyoxylase-like metal-dependent hydrolase (beta-lactamase superfamily II)|uniref:MBL fold metallo-hydrolase n=1 Tax=Ottowia sp. TaxID=1898956 RepID=UPI0025CEE3BB|nr:MBL fold metallo-hydrolase [Ottowia sp.]MBK6613460.1 MBL fold metallo-hydrolase [Ottowia sp.]MBK6747432.1 MBL fold metallo-hydrolase [Ottowia sp.]